VIHISLATKRRKRVRRDQTWIVVRMAVVELFRIKEKVGSILEEEIVCGDQHVVETVGGQ